MFTPQVIIWLEEHTLGLTPGGLPDGEGICQTNLSSFKGSANHNKVIPSIHPKIIISLCHSTAPVHKVSKLPTLTRPAQGGQSRQYSFSYLV